MNTRTKMDLLDVIKTIFGHLPFCFENDFYQSNEEYLEDIICLSIIQKRLMELKSSLLSFVVNLKNKDPLDYEFESFNPDEDKDAIDKKLNSKFKIYNAEISNIKKYLNEYYNKMKQTVKNTIDRKQVRLFLEEIFSKHKFSQTEKIVYYFIFGYCFVREIAFRYSDVEIAFLFDYNIKNLKKLESFVTTESKLISTGLLIYSNNYNKDYKHVEIPKRVISIIMGIESQNSDVMDYAKVYSPSIDLDDVVLNPELKKRVISIIKGYNEFDSIKKKMGFNEGLTKKNGYLIMLEGVSGTGKTLLAEGIAKYLNKKLMNIDTRSFVYENIKDEKILSSAFENILLEARINDALVFFDECEELFNPYHRSVFLPVLEKFNGIILCATNLAQDFMDEALNRRILVRIRFELPDINDRELIWKKHIPVNNYIDSKIDFKYLAQKYEFSGGLIKNAVIKAVNYSISNGDKKLKQSSLETACDEILDNEINNELGKASDELVSMKDLIFDNKTDLTIKRLIGACNNKNKLFIDWGLGDKYHYGNNIVALFYGESGVGKTACAEAIARELGYSFVRVSISDIQSMWVGVTQKNITKIFRQHNARKVVLFFDEADALFSKRTDIRNSVDKEKNRDVNVLLQELEKFDGIVILTSNKPEAFDEAFSRRINFKIRFNKPDKLTRLKIWKKQVPNKIEISKDVDFNYLSEKYELSGAEIKNSVFRAATIAVCDNSKILEMHHFIQAIEEEIRNDLDNKKLMGFV